MLHQDAVRGSSPGRPNSAATSGHCPAPALRRTQQCAPRLMAVIRQISFIYATDESSPDSILNAQAPSMHQTVPLFLIWAPSPSAACLPVSIPQAGSCPSGAAPSSSASPRGPGLGSFPFPFSAWSPGSLSLLRCHLQADNSQICLSNPTPCP